jgi:hypothetical protein
VGRDGDHGLGSGGFFEGSDVNLLSAHHALIFFEFLFASAGGRSRPASLLPAVDPSSQRPAPLLIGFQVIDRLDLALPAECARITDLLKQTHADMLNPKNAPTISKIREDRGWNTPS